MSESTQVSTMTADDARKLLQEQSAAMKAKIGAGGGDKIRLTKKKTFKMPDGTESTPGDPLRVVVLDFVAYNAFYDRPFDPSGKTAAYPACFALGAVKPNELVPSKASPDRQSEVCGQSGKSGCCPNNEFGSKNAGKACGNHYLLAVVGVDKPDSDMYVIQTPPKSGKYWEAQFQQVLASYPGLLAASMEIWFDEASDSQLLRFGNQQENPWLVQHMGRRAAATARLLREPDVSGYEPLKKKGK